MCPRPGSTDEDEGKFLSRDRGQWVIWRSPGSVPTKVERGGLEIRIPFDGLSSGRIARAESLRALKPSGPVTKQRYRLIPTAPVQNPWAHFRVPMEAMRAGCETRLFQAWQQWSSMSS